jgi:exodeoxyribonuclease VII small subunit
MPEPLQTFEQRLARIEQIVKELEGAGTDLARATLLFKEGKALIRECDQLLKTAEASIKEADRADERSSSAAPAEEGDIPF